MSGHITLHPEHGLNPSMDCCFWCGNVIGVALLGHNGGREAPRYVVSSQEPCDACKRGMAMGITLMKATEDGRGRLAPTGDYVVVTEEAIKRILDGNDGLLSETLEKRKAYLDPEMWKLAGLDEVKEARHGS